MTPTERAAVAEAIAALQQCRELLNTASEQSVNECRSILDKSLASLRAVAPAPADEWFTGKPDPVNGADITDREFYEMLAMFKKPTPVDQSDAGRDGAIEEMCAIWARETGYVPFGEFLPDSKARWLKAMQPVLDRASAPSETVGRGEGSFQSRVKPWMDACFGPEISSDMVERGDRHLEEVLELLQSGGYDLGRVAPICQYVADRPAGEPAQEVGGVMVTLAAYCLAAGLDMHTAGETELARVWTKIEKIRAKQAAKPKHSPLPIATPLALPAADRDAIREALKDTHTFLTNLGADGFAVQKLQARITAALALIGEG